MYCIYIYYIIIILFIYIINESLQNSHALKKIYYLFRNKPSLEKKNDVKIQNIVKVILYKIT